VALRELVAHRFMREPLPLGEINFYEVIVDIQVWLIMTTLAKDIGDNVRRLPRTPQRAADNRVDTLGQQMLAC